MTSDKLARPWTVYLLAALSLAGSLWGFVDEAARTPWDVVSLLGGLWVTYGIWVGWSWAFTLTFVLASLCVAFAVAMAILQVFLYETGLSAAIIWTLIPSLVLAALAMHPASKRFTGVASPQVPIDRV